jgi:hypothetical protein
MAENWDHGYASKVYVFTVLNLTEWEDYQGNKHTCEKELFVAKKSTIEALKIHAQNLKNEGRGLRGTLFDVHRTTKKQSPGTGDLFVPHQTYDVNQLRQQGIDVEPFDYQAIFTPDMEEIQKIIQRKNNEISQGVSDDFGNAPGGFGGGQQFAPQMQQPQQVPSMGAPPMQQQPPQPHQQAPPQFQPPAPQPPQPSQQPPQQQPQFPPMNVPQQGESPSTEPNLGSPAFMGPQQSFQQGGNEPPFEANGNIPQQSPQQPPQNTQEPQISNNIGIDYS